MLTVDRVRLAAGAFHHLAKGPARSGEQVYKVIGQAFQLLGMSPVTREELRRAFPGAGQIPADQFLEELATTAAAATPRFGEVRMTQVLGLLAGPVPSENDIHAAYVRATFAESLGHAAPAAANVEKRVRLSESLAALRVIRDQVSSAPSITGVEYLCGRDYKQVFREEEAKFMQWKRTTRRTLSDLGFTEDHNRFLDEPNAPELYRAYEPGSSMQHQQLDLMDYFSNQLVRLGEPSDRPALEAAYKVPSKAAPQRP